MVGGRLMDHFHERKAKKLRGLIGKIYIRE
jgi:hypothetical protein